MNDLYRVCVKLYSPEPTGIDDDAAVFVPIFHDWIRRGLLNLVAIDVADYAHVPESPGIMLVTHEAAFALDRSDGRFGLLVQRRVPVAGTALDVLATTLRDALRVAARLEGEPVLANRLKFDASRPRFEANDRLRVPNNDSGYRTFEPMVRTGLEAVFPGRPVTLMQVPNDPRDRLAIEARVEAEADVSSHLAA